MYAYEADGNAVAEGWPQATDASVKGSVVVANMDDDADLEVVAADFKGNLYVWGAERDSITIYLPFVIR